MLTSHAGALYPHIRDPLGGAVKALLHFEGADGSTVFFDDSIYHGTYLPNPDVSGSGFALPKITTAESRFGVGSLDLSGDVSNNHRVSGIYCNGPHLILPTSLEPFCVEFWVYWPGTFIPAGKNFTLFSFIGSVVGFTNSLDVSIVPFGSIKFAQRFSIDATVALTVGWNYVAIQRGPDGHSHYFNGALVLDGAISNFAAGSDVQMIIAQQASDGTTSSGVLVDEFRVTYAQRFTQHAATIPIPTKKFPNP